MDECIAELKLLVEKHRFKTVLDREVRGPKGSRLIFAEHALHPIDAMCCVSDRGATFLFEDNFVAIKSFDECEVPVVGEE